MAYQVYVTQGELAVVIGIQEYGYMLTWLKTNMEHLYEVLVVSKTGLFLDNPELKDVLLPALTSYGAFAAASDPDKYIKSTAVKTKVLNYIAANMSPKLTPTATRPTISLYSIGTGFGYLVTNGPSNIKQDYAPAVNGNYLMSEIEATSLANYLADKIYIGLHPTITIQQIMSLWDGSKTSQQLIDEEISGL